jgi:hypothetical protein
MVDVSHLKFGIDNSGISGNNSKQIGSLPRRPADQRDRETEVAKFRRVLLPHNTVSLSSFQSSSSFHQIKKILNTNIVYDISHHHRSIFSVIYCLDDTYIHTYMYARM